jgi:hypothetical protein
LPTSRHPSSLSTLPILTPKPSRLQALLDATFAAEPSVSYSNSRADQTVPHSQRQRTFGHPYTPPEPRLSSWPASPSLGDLPPQLTSLARNTLQAVLRPRLFACLSANPPTVPPPWSAGHLPTKFSLGVTNSTVARSPTTVDDLQRPHPRCAFLFPPQALVRSAPEIRFKRCSSFLPPSRLRLPLERIH